MADFSVQATTVEAPQAAGAQPIAPVQEQLPASGWGQALENLGKQVGTVVGDVFKAERQKKDLAFLQDLSQKTAALNSAVDQGMSATEADTRQRTLYSQALAARPDLASQVNGLFGAFNQTTNTGTVRNQIQQAEQLRQTQLTSASNNGYYISPTASKANQDAVIQANESGIRVQKEFEAQAARAAEARAQGTYDRTLFENQNKDNTVRLAAGYASDNINAFYAQIDDLRSQVAAGKLTPQDARIQLDKNYSVYAATLSSIGGSNPGLVGGYSDMFKNMHQAGMDALDPSKDAQTSKAQLDSLKYKAALNVYTNNPQLTPLIGTTELLGSNNPALQAFGTGEAAQIIVKAINNPVTNGKANAYNNPIVGNPQAESQTLDFLKKSVRTINSGGFSNEAKAKIEAANGVNNVLVETGRALNTGADPKSLNGLVDFFASPEYGSMVKGGLIDPVAQQAAAKTFQITYMPAVTNAITPITSQTLIKGDGGVQKDVPVSQAVDVSVGPDGSVKFVPRPGINLTPDQQNVEQSAIGQLAKVESKLNQMIHLGAHMEGSTDYAAHWEKNKYYYLPQIYPVKPGQVVGNLKWSGEGDWRDKNTWSRVGQR